MDFTDVTLGLVVIFILFIVIFFVAREIMLWYWKVDKIVDLLEEIKKNTISKSKEVNKPLDVPANSEDPNEKQIQSTPS